MTSEPPGDLRIDEDLRLPRLVLLGEVHGDKAQRFADLDGGEPDAGRRVHRLEHVVDQRAHRFVERLHRAGLQAQAFVGKNEDIADGHGGDVRANGGAVNARFLLEPRALIALPFALRSRSGGRIGVEAAQCWNAHVGNVLIALTAVIAVGVVAILVLLLRPRAVRRWTKLADQWRVQSMGEMLASATQLQQTVHERLDAVTQNLGQSMQTSTKNTTDHFKQLHDRLAVIDSAQKNITDLATQVNSLHSVLANKQSRGAFGQGQLEAIITDALPKGAFEFQFTLSNKSRPDCCDLHAGQATSRY